ncbi:hypothetical protein [Nocardioides zeae]
MLAALLAVVLGLAGCVRLPDSGDVTVPDDVPEDVGNAAVDYVPPGPTPGRRPTRSCSTSSAPCGRRRCRPAWRGRS